MARSTTGSYDPRTAQSLAINLAAAKGYTPRTNNTRVMVNGNKQIRPLGDSDTYVRELLAADGTAILLGTYPVNPDGGSALNGAL